MDSRARPGQVQAFHPCAPRRQAPAGTERSDAAAKGLRMAILYGRAPAPWTAQPPHADRPAQRRRVRALLAVVPARFPFCLG
jgi:hypothetical protein